MRQILLLFLLLGAFWLGASAQTKISGHINTYGKVTAIDSKKQVITVDSGANFYIGEAVMIIQMKGATTDSSNTSAFGSITRYNNSGNYEFRRISRVCSNKITLDSQLKRNYTVSGIVQLVGVPEYKSAKVTGVLSPIPWNGTKGGVLALTVKDTLYMSSNIDASYSGFLGAPMTTNGYDCGYKDYYYGSTSIYGALKGEGIRILTSSYTRGRGAAANGGGGGDDHNSGGGGGSNASAGGKGGYQWNLCSSTLLDNGGLGGYALDSFYSLNKIFMGGAGGAGHNNNGHGSSGGNGGGIIIIKAGTLKSNGYQLKSNGADVTTLSSDDGSGAGGAGGSILLDITSYGDSCKPVAIGGYGGSTTYDSVGPGGGGSGGIVWYSQTSLPSLMKPKLTGGKYGVITGKKSPYGAKSGTDGKDYSGFSVVLPTPVKYKLKVSNDTIMCSGSTAKLFAVITNADSLKFTFTWDNSLGAGDSQSVTPKTNTTYQVIASLCGRNVDTAKVKVSLIPAFTYKKSPDTTVCAGQTVNMRIVPSGGDTSTYSFVWDNALGSGKVKTVNPKKTTVYHVAIYDACKGTAVNDSIIVTIASVNVNKGKDTSVCVGNSVILGKPSVSGNSYLWSTGQKTAQISVSPAKAQYYSLTQTNSIGCSNKDSVLVTVNSYPIGHKKNDTVINICNGSTAVMDARNTGNKYTWSTGDTSRKVSVQKAGKYWVKISNGYCSITDTFEVKVGSFTPVNLGKDTVLCDKASFFVDGGSAGGSHLWSTGDTTQAVTLTKAGTYWMKVSFGSGCTGSDTIKVGFQKKPVLAAMKDTQLCSGVSVFLYAGDHSAKYSWSTGDTSNSITVTKTGKYTVTADNGCKANESVSITFIKTPVVSLGNDTAICGSAYTLNAANPSAVHIWSTGDTTRQITVNQSGTYWAKASVSGCSSSDTVRVRLEQPPVLILPNDTSLCSGPSVLLHAGGNALHYKWSTGDTTMNITVGKTGVYSIVASNELCSSSGKVNVSFIAPPVLNLGKDTTVCANAFILDAGSPKLRHTWNTGDTTPSLTISKGGTYWASLSNDYCTSYDTIRVNFLEAPVIDLPKDTLSCAGTVIKLHAGDTRYKYQWNTGETTPDIFIQKAGMYKVTASYGACTVSDSVNAAFDSIVLKLPSDTIICGAGSVELSAGISGMKYLWSTGDTASKVKIGQAGRYWLMVKDKMCSASDTSNISFVSLPDLNYLKDTLICRGATALLRGPADVTHYSWSTGDTSQSIKVNTAGTYTLNAASGICSVSRTIVVGFLPQPVLKHIEDQYICPDDKDYALLTAPAQYRHIWLPMYDTTRTVQISDSGTYILKATNMSGCTQADTFHVMLRCPPTLYVPSVFSPNGDSTNELFRAVGTNITGFHMTIFNRWGERIFETSNFYGGWDGTFKNTPAPEGCFLYMIEYEGFSKTGYKIRGYKNGTFTLVR